MVVLELAGPTRPESIFLIPDNLRAAAGWAIDKCVANTGGIGGFVTGSMEDMFEFVTKDTTKKDDPYRT